MTEQEFVERIHALGGRAFIVGGWVRDRLREKKAEKEAATDAERQKAREKVVPHDKDYLITGVSEADFERVIFAPRVGRGFPVYLVEIDGVRSEVAFARKERKTGPGYRGFAVDFDPAVTIEADLYRRDTRMNAMAIELPAGALIDPYGGAADIERGVIDAVSEHFTEDPVRALRAARQSAQFSYDITERTTAYMRACRSELAAEPTERIAGELIRALGTDAPERFFLALERADLLATVFPELHALIGQTQPAEYHPEGDAFNHTMKILHDVARATDSIGARFGALVHDLGKGVTPKELLPHHYGHEAKGLDVLTAWNSRMTMPHKLVEAGRFAIKEHMRAPVIKKMGKQADLLLAIKKSPLTLKEFSAIIVADSPHDYLPDYLKNGQKYLDVMEKVSGRDAPKRCKGPDIGNWVHSQQLARFKEMREKDDPKKK